MFRASLLSAFLPALAAFLPAQTANHLIGVTRNLGDVRHQSHPTCAQLATCTPVGFPSGAGLPAEAGGTAWDAAHSGAWITNGRFLACVGDTCTYKCAPFLVPGLGNAVIVGLEVVTQTNRLWAIDNVGTLRVFDLAACPPVQVNACTVGFVNPLDTTGLAVDELAGLVFYGRVDPVTGINHLAVAELATPCVPVQLLPLPTCAGPSDTLRGLAVDAVRRIVYGTDGERTLAIGYQPIAPGAVAITGFNCCPSLVANPDPMVGLAIRPALATTTGSSCAAGSCNNCPMNHDTVGDSVLGNASFALRLGGAPAGSLAWAFIGVGLCLSPGIPLGGFCGNAHLPSLLGVLGAQLVPVGGLCGSTDFSLPLPAAASLGGVVLSSQCLVLCAGGGHALSHGLSFELQGL